MSFQIFWEINDTCIMMKWHKLVKNLLQYNINTKHVNTPDNNFFWDQYGAAGQFTWQWRGSTLPTVPCGHNIPKVFVELHKWSVVFQNAGGRGGGVELAMNGVKQLAIKVEPGHGVSQGEG